MFWADYWADTGRLSAAQHGAYLNLMGRYWREKGLPNDDGDLQRLSTMTPSEWKANRTVILAFFKLEGDRLTHKRIDHEISKATTAYEKRVEAARRTNEIRNAPRDANRDGDRDGDRDANRSGIRDVTHNSDITNVIKSSNDDLAIKPRKRATSLPSDWTPTPQDIAHAAAKGLDSQTIRAIAENFRDDNIAKGRTSKDWAASWRTWIAKHIGWNGTGPWPRHDAGRPKANAGGRPSALAQRDQLRAEAGLQRERNIDAVRVEGGAWSEGIDGSSGGIIAITFADHDERSDRPDYGTEIIDQTGTGHGSGPDRTSENLHQQDVGISSGRGAPCAEESAQILPLVARMAGT